MEEDIPITEENLTDFLAQDLDGLKALMDCEELSLDPTPDPLPEKRARKICSYCGIMLFEGPKNEFRCGSCGCIQYKNMEVK